MANREWGLGLGNFLGPNLFHISETPFLNREGITKGHFYSFAENGRHLDPQDISPSCVPATVKPYYSLMSDS